MKYSLLTILISLFSLTAFAQLYTIDDEIKLPETGVAYAILNAETQTYISCKTGANGGMLTTVEDDDALWMLEDTGEKTPAGYTLYYIYSVGQKKYIQETDFENNPDLDGFDIYHYRGFNFDLGTKEHAAKVTIEKGTVGTDTEANEAWRTNGPSTGFVIARQNVVTRPSGDKWFFKFGVQNTDVAFEPYGENIAWQLWTTRPLTPAEELENLINKYSAKEFRAGTDPGFYEASAVASYSQALEHALLVIVSGEDDDVCIQAINDLKQQRAAVEKAAIPITEGYYYIISGFDDYMYNLGLEKAAYPNTMLNCMSYKTFDPDNVDFVFNIAPNTANGAEANEYIIQSYSTDLYADRERFTIGSQLFLNTQAEEPQTLRLYTCGKWFWATRTYNQASLSPSRDYIPEAADTEGPLYSRGNWDDEATSTLNINLWYLRRVPADKIADFETQKLKNQISKHITDLAIKGTDLYSSLFTYNTDFNSPLITQAGGGFEEEPMPGDQLCFSHINQQGIGGADEYKYLIDSCDSTYMQGSGYIQADISKTPTQIITIEYDARCSSGKYGTVREQNYGKDERPDNIDIYATNDLTDGGEWTWITNTYMGALTTPARYTIDLGQPYKYLRYKVNTNATSDNFFTVSEFQLYPVSIDQSTSQYYTTAGMKEAADNMRATITAKLAIADHATEQDIKELQQAIDAVKGSHADTTYLSNLAAECAALAATTEIGDGIGKCLDAQVVEALGQAAIQAKAIISPTVSVAELDKATAQLEKAKADYLAAFKMYEPNTWYHLVNADRTPGSIIKGCPLLSNGNVQGQSLLMVGVINAPGSPFPADYSAAATHMWRFVPAKTEGAYYIQNLATGFYPFEFESKNKGCYISYTAPEYYVRYTGYGAFSLIPVKNNPDNYALGTSTSMSPVTSCNFIAQTSGTSSDWTIVPVSQEVEYIVSNEVADNSINILALPYELSELTTDINTNFKLYGIRKMTQHKSDDQLITDIEFYEKTSAKAGEPVFYKAGALNPSNELAVPMPTEAVSEKTAANGLVGFLHMQNVEAGVAISDGTSLTATTATTQIAAYRGAIDPATYQGEVTDQETAFTITLAGLNPLPATKKTGDVNSDGSINATDVVSVYNYTILGTQSGITKEAADVNSDGDVNATDVVTIYNIIIGGKGLSPRFIRNILKQ